MSRQRVEEILKHTGTKGMKWGVIKWRQPGDHTPADNPGGRLKQEWNSAKRERHWKKVVNDVHNLTTKEIGVVAKRAGLENELKRLAKTSDDKKNYRLRANMTDQELNRKVARLRVISSMSSQADAASKKQRDLGMRIVNTGGTLLLKAYINKKTGTKMNAGDIFDSVMNPKVAKDQAIKLGLNAIFKKKA
jgi:hypothetical protein